MRPWLPDPHPRKLKRLALFCCCREYTGHASHVIAVRWSPNNRWLVSVGGRDRAVFQWRTLRQAPGEAHAPKREATAGVFNYPAIRAAGDADSDASLAAPLRAPAAVGQSQVVAKSTAWPAPGTATVVQVAPVRAPAAQQVGSCN
jgi:hypothetical protein